MVLPDNRFDFNYRPSRKSKKRWIPIAGGVVLVALIVVGISWRDRIAAFFDRESEPQPDLAVLWEEQQYEAINERCREILDESPMSYRTLVFNGFAYFYRSVGRYTPEERLPFLDGAIWSLRKALLFDNPEDRGQIEYVLGKAYHFKGNFYADLTIDYLERSIRNGYIGEDTYEYLGLAYSGLGNYAQSAHYFELAVEQRPTDMRYLALAQSYVNSGDHEAAERYLLRTINKTTDPSVEQKARFLIGGIYLENDQLTKAEDQYRSILELNPRSADAHYYLGEIFTKYGRSIEARSEWREALRIDPSHYGARLRYYP